MLFIGAGQTISELVLMIGHRSLLDRKDTRERKGKKSGRTEVQNAKEGVEKGLIFTGLAFIC